MRSRWTRRRGSSNATCSSSAAATPGSGPRGRSSQLEPEAKVVLLEAGRCGHGPSGRNGGFANAMWFRMGGHARALRRLSRDRARPRLDEAVAEIGRFCERAGGGRLVSRSPATCRSRRRPPRTGRGTQRPSACQARRARRRHRADAAEVAARCRSPRFRAAAFYPAAATVQPGAARARASRPPRRARRVEVFERSPLRSCAPDRGAAWPRRPAARVRAGACGLAIGPATGGTGSPLRGPLTVTSSHMPLTEPVPDVLEEIGWTGGECITDGRAMLHYFRTTPDGRIAFGWGGGLIACGARLGGRTELDAEVIRQVEADLRSFFPGLEGRRVTHAWGGPIDVSPSTCRVAARVGSDNVWAAFGYTGNGVGPVAHDGPRPRLARPRPPRRALPPRGRRARRRPRPRRPPGLHRRQRDPGRPPRQGVRRGAGAGRPTRSTAASPRSPSGSGFTSGDKRYFRTTPACAKTGARPAASVFARVPRLSTPPPTNS